MPAPSERVPDVTLGPVAVFAAEPNDDAVAPARVVDWRRVPPVRGFWGAFDRFFGPGMTAREWIVLLAGILVAYAGMIALWTRHDATAWFPHTALLWALIASADVFGGIMTNATNSAKRWYHPVAASGHRMRLVFISMHIAHLAAIAFLVLPFAMQELGFAPWQWFALNLALLYALAAAVEFTPLDIQRPVAFAAWLAAVFVNLVVVPLPLILSYFVPLFFLKLLICYVPIEAPWRTRPPGKPLALARREVTEQD